MLLSRHQNAGKNHDIERAKRRFENVADLKYLGATVTNLIQEKMSSHLLSKNVKIRIYKTIILPVVLCGRETSYLT
jgi:hypothetical protein